MAKCLGRIQLTSAVVAVGIGCWQQIVAGRLASATACSGFVLLPGAGASKVALLAVGCHKICRSEYHLGVVDRS